MKIGTIIRLLAYKTAEAVERLDASDREIQEAIVLFRRETRDELRAQTRNIERLLVLQREQGERLQKIVEMIAEDKRPTLRMQALALAPKGSGQ